MTKEPILYVDDENINVLGFQASFWNDYTIFVARSPKEGLQIMQSNEIKVIISDQRMPGMTGIELLKIISKEYPDSIRMLLTAYNDVDTVMQAINEGGVYRFLLKPWNYNDLKIAIDNAIELYQLKKHNKQLIENLTQTNVELEKHKNSLELLVDERTYELQLRNQQLKELIATKDKFFSIIAHDLKNPFNVIINFAQLSINYLNNNDLAGASQFADKIFTSAKMSYNLLDNLLHWARSQTGIITPAIVEVNIKDVVLSTIHIVDEYAQKKQIALENYCVDDFYLLTDKNIIETVLRNLLTNAIKYTTAGGCVKVRISHQANKAEISIIDTGIGIKPEHIQKLFRIDGNFARVGTEQERGTGLGLILCRELIEKIGGTIGVESVFGKGSRFFFEILTDTTHKPIAQPLSERMIT